MKVKSYFKLRLFLFMSALVAGVIFLCGFSFFGKLPRGTIIDGIDVGGMSRTAAIAAVRDNIEDGLKDKRLEVVANDRVYSYAYPEINYRDNLFSLVRSISRSGEYHSGVSYYLCGAKEVISGICAGESVDLQEPYAMFSAAGEPFTYYEGHDGRRADAALLACGIERSLQGGFERVKLTVREYKRKKTIDDIRAETVLLSQFSTYFDDGNASRSHNIALAAAGVNGSVIRGGGTLSFNDIVGERTAQRGFKEAKIIENGEYIQGLGGGVCQVSTTLYNAALLSGLKIKEYHPHSLSVGYVPPSRDAMVSGSSCDLKIMNPLKTPVYIRAECSRGRLTVRIYGKSTGEVYSIETVVSGGIVAPEEFTDDPTKAREGRDGVLSESFLIVKKGEDVRRVRLRYDKYLPQKRVVYRGGAQDTAEPTFNRKTLSNNCVFFQSVL